jgi:hypothetical protein
MLPNDLGYMLKIGTFVFPNELIKRGTYKTAPAQRQSNGDYVDADGYLHTAPMPHTRSKIEFYTVPMRKYQMRALMDAIVAQYTDALDKKVPINYYEEEYGEYVDGDFYLSSTQEYTYLDVDTYDSCRFAFIEY